MRGGELIPLFSKTFRALTFLTAVAGLLLSPCQAADGSKTNAPATPATKTPVEVSDQLKMLRKRVDEVDSAYAAYVKGIDSDQRSKLWEVYTRENDALIPRILEVVRRAPNSPAAFELIQWVVTNGRISARSLRPYGLQAVEILRNGYTNYPNLGRVCRALAFAGDPSNQPTMEFLQIVSTGNPNRAARGSATFALARLTKTKAEGLAFLESFPPNIYTNLYPNVTEASADYEQASKNGGSKAVFQRAEQLFETIQKKYADCSNFESGPGLRQPKPTLGEQAGVELYECQHLVPGKIAPELEGEDLDGHKFKLSDYRGKVVILSFWASWCGPCMQMLPHECAMAQRLEGKPFAIVGVNGDATQQDAKSAAEKNHITWRSFWNGTGGPWSGTAAAWNVNGWPTVLILDAKGMIRLKLTGYGGKRMDSLLDQLVDHLLNELGSQQR